MTGTTSVARKLWRGGRALLVAPPLVGAAYVLGLTVLAGRGSIGADEALRSLMLSDHADLRSVRVEHVEALESFASHRLASEIVRVKIGIIATALALGIVLGLAAEGLVALRRSRMRRSSRRCAARDGARSIALVASLHALLVLWSMADAPQIYASRWYAQGGLARTAQVIATDGLGPRGVVVLALVLALAYLRPSWIAGVARRPIVSVRRLARAVVAVGRSAKGTFVLVLAIGVGLVAARPRLALSVRAFALPAESRAPSEGRMNVLVLAVDALRADRLDPRVAPNVSRLAARGTCFDRVYVSLPRTLPSWVTLLTGRHAHHHGVRSTFPTWEERAKDLDALPARFARAGYATIVASDDAGDVFGRVDLGFGRVETPELDRPFRTLLRPHALEQATPLLPVLHSRLGRRISPVMRARSSAADPTLLAADVDAALRGVRDRPFFMTVFFGAAHSPYASPAPYYAKYTDASYRGRFKYHAPVGLSADVPPDAEDIRQIRALYDGAVSAIDDAVGRVVQALERLGVAERTIIVVTADHGEALFEHGHGLGHGDHLFGDEGTHVPLIVYDPRSGGGGDEGRRCEGRIVRDVDLAPTLYELVGIAAPSDLDGRSLAPALRGEALEPRLAYAETELWWREDIAALPPELRIPYPGILALTEIDARHGMEIVLREEVKAATLVARHRMVRDERFKLVYVPTRTGVRYMLFDTLEDPGETTDIAAARPDEVTRLKTELWAWMLQDPVMEQLNGYLVPRDARGAP